MTYCTVALIASGVIALVLTGIGYLLGYRVGHREAIVEIALVEEWGMFRTERREGFARVAKEFAEEQGEVGVIMELHGADISMEDYVSGPQRSTHEGLYESLQLGGPRWYPTLRSPLVA